MITIDVAEYCSACMNFDPDVQRPQKAYRMSEEIVISDTVIRCSNRNRCKNIERYLRKKVTNYIRLLARGGLGKSEKYLVDELQMMLSAMNVEAATVDCDCIEVLRGQQKEGL